LNGKKVSGEWSMVNGELLRRSNTFVAKKIYGVNLMFNKVQSVEECDATKV